MNPSKVGIVQPAMQADHTVSLQGSQALAAICPQGTGSFASENLYPQATSSEHYMLSAGPRELINSLELWTELVDMWWLPDLSGTPEPLTSP